MTVSDQVPIVQEESAVRYTAGTGIQRADVHPRAKQPNTALRPATESDTPGEVATVQERAQKAADDLAGRVRGKFAGLAGGPSLLDAQPPSLAQARQHVHDCANHLNGDAWKALRILYGYLHLQLKFVLHAIEWVTRSPWGLLITGFAVFVIVKWI